MMRLKIAGNVLLVLGLTLGLFVVYELYGTTAATAGHQAVLAREFERTDTSTAYGAGVPGLGTPVGRLRIPKLRVDRIVVEGTALAQLSLGPGHYVKTQMPWEPGTVGIAGHRTTHGAPFYDLSHLARGDLISLEARGETFTYRVTSKRIVNPGEGWVLNGDPRSTAGFKLTLTTCTPRFSAAHRLVVFADRVG